MLNLLSIINIIKHKTRSTTKLFFKHQSMRLVPVVQKTLAGDSLRWGRFTRKFLLIWYFWKFGSNICQNYWCKFLPLRCESLSSQLFEPWSLPVIKIFRYRNFRLGAPCRCQTELSKTPNISVVSTKKSHFWICFRVRSWALTSKCWNTNFHIWCYLKAF